MALMEQWTIGMFLLVCLGVGGGSAIGIFYLFQRSVYGIFLLCGALLIGVVCIEIIPLAMNERDIESLAVGSMIGLSLFITLHFFLHSFEKANHSVLLIFLAMILHTIPFSLTLWAIIHKTEIFTSLTILSGIHHIPEGFAITLALLSKGEASWKSLLYYVPFALLFISFMSLGIFFSITDRVQSVLIAMTGSLIFFTSLHEFILSYWNRLSRKQAYFFLLTGIILSITFHIIVEK